MIRKIVDYQKLSEDILNLLIDKFPDGYDDDDIISFKNIKGEVVEAVEVKTEDTIYLVKVGIKLVKAMENFADDDDDNGFRDNNFSNDENEDKNIDINDLDNLEDTDINT